MRKRGGVRPNPTFRELNQHIVDKKATQKTLKRIKDIKYSPLTTEQRTMRLERIYDDALAWLEDAVTDREPKGTGAATMILERARMEVDEIERTGKGSKKQEITLIFKSGDDAVKA